MPDNYIFPTNRRTRHCHHFLGDDRVQRQEAEIQRPPQPAAQQHPVNYGNRKSWMPCVAGDFSETQY